MTETMITLEQFEDKYLPKQNHMRKDASESGCMYETYGKEVEWIKHQNPKHVWTVLEVDGKWYYSAGFHYVNRFGYIWTQNPWDTGLEEVDANF